jgi:hypothetical protein
MEVRTAHPTEAAQHRAVAVRTKVVPMKREANTMAQAEATAARHRPPPKAPSSASTASARG